MKRVSLIIVALLLSLAACSAPAQEEASPSEKQSAAPTPTPTSALIVSPALPSSPSHSSELPDGFSFVEPLPDTVIISSGGICGGYSDGKWLTHSEAAEYCGGELTFNICNLAGSTGSIVSSGVEYPDEVIDCYVYSRTTDMEPETFDELGFFYLDIETSQNIDTSQDEGNMPDYSADHLNSFNLIMGGFIPETEVVSDTSSLLPVIQRMVDKHFGKGVVEASISVAVRADIDGDGKKEVLINSDNNGQMKYDYTWGDVSQEEFDKFYADYKPDNWYSLCCIIDDDGSVIIVDEYYGPDYLEESCILYAQNIIDIDGDGVCEIIVDWETWETWGTIIYKYDKEKYAPVMYYISGN